MTRRTVAAGLLAALLIAGLVALGTWQVQRRAWKLDLIATVDARIHAAPVAAPGAGDPQTGARYLRVRARGTYLPGQVLVQASTVRGAGWWVVTPLKTRDFVVLVNRGFVAERKAPAPPSGAIDVTGLLRLSEPDGGFLRSNDPVADRWYSRDVAAITAARGLTGVVPYFIDADGAANGPGQPVGGLTVIAFPNTHLVYAITWYGLAMMVGAGFLILLRLERRRGA